ncbi:MAG: histidine phosphatase family protein [Bacteroidetes bacterium]|nr:histidine phosphatase family protein [Bacteroidota bacterium]
MKNLILMRHAKAENPFDISDQQRKLTTSGVEEAESMAKKMLKKNLKISYIISSPANRTKQTAEIIAKHYEIDPAHIVYETTLYEARLSNLLDVVNEIDESKNDVLLVGHNPSMSDAVGLFTQKNLDNLPTAGVLQLQFKKSKWQDIEPHCGELISLDHPSKFKK